MIDHRVAAALVKHESLGPGEMSIGRSVAPAVLATPAAFVVAGYFIACWQAGTAVTQVMNAGRVAHDRLDEKHTSI
jgi:hypothetical protein